MPMSAYSAGPEHHFVFIGGLHRSGTTALRRMIQSHPLVSGFSSTGVDEDEGQFLQSVYPTDAYFGGPGVFGLHPEARMTEKSPLCPAAKERLFYEWAPYWNLSKPFLVEKTPGNLIRSRFLQEIFPNSTFIFIARHPAACTLATLKWQSRVSPTEMIKHWINCHNMYSEDQFYLRRKMLITYEELCSHPQETMERISQYIGVSAIMATDFFNDGLNDRYFDQWRTGKYRLWLGPDHWKAPLQRWRNLAESAYISKRYERDINRFGYSFDIMSPAQDGLRSPQLPQAAVSHIYAEKAIGPQQ